MFSSITGLLGQFKGSAAPPVFKFSPIGKVSSCVQQDHWFTKSVHGFSSIPKLLCQFIVSVASLVYKVSSWFQQHHWFTRYVSVFSSITGLLGKFVVSAASLVY